MTDWRDRIGLLAPLIVMAAIALSVGCGKQERQRSPNDLFGQRLDARDAYVFGTWVDCEVLFGPPGRECRIKTRGDRIMNVR